MTSPLDPTSATELPLETEEDIALFLEASRLCDDPDLLRDAEQQAALARKRLRTPGADVATTKLLAAIHRVPVKRGGQGRGR